MQIFFSKVPPNGIQADFENRKIFLKRRRSPALKSYPDPKGPKYLAKPTGFGSMYINSRLGGVKQYWWKIPINKIRGYCNRPTLITLSPNIFEQGGMSPISVSYIQHSRVAIKVLLRNKKHLTAGMFDHRTFKRHVILKLIDTTSIYLDSSQILLCCNWGGG